MITDRGTAFTAASFEKFCQIYGIAHVLNAVATPRANGQCERYNRTVLSAIATSAAGLPEDKWDTVVKQVQSAMNCTVNKATGVSPLEVLAGYHPRNPANARLSIAVSDAQNLHRLDLQALRNTISSRITEDQRKQKARFDRSRTIA